MSTYPNTCSICLDDISANEDKVTTLECNHPFHTNCISQLRSNKCPSCRTRFTNISPEILSEIYQRESADICSRNAENFNFTLNNFIRLGNTDFALSEGPLGLSLPPTNTSDVNTLLLQNMIRSSLFGSPPPTNHSDRDGPGEQGTDEIHFLLQNMIRSTLSSPTPSPNSLDESTPAPPSLSDIALSVMGSLLPNIAPALFTLLNTPFQGVTLNSMLEDYIVRNTM